MQRFSCLKLPYRIRDIQDAKAEEISYHMLAEAYIGAKRYAEAVEAYRQVANVTRHDHMKKIAREGIHKASVEGILPIHPISEESQDFD